MTNTTDQTTVSEHQHEIACEKAGISWCSCGMFFRKPSCPEGIWHHVSELDGSSHCPCERAEAKPQQKHAPVVQHQTNGHGGGGRRQRRGQTKPGQRR